MKQLPPAGPSLARVPPRIVEVPDRLAAAVEDERAYRADLQQPLMLPPSSVDDLYNSGSSPYGNATALAVLRFARFQPKSLGGLGQSAPIATGAPRWYTPAREVRERHYRLQRIGKLHLHLVELLGSKKPCLVLFSCSIGMWGACINLFACIASLNARLTIASRG